MESSARLVECESLKRMIDVETECVDGSDRVGADAIAAAFEGTGAGADQILNTGRQGRQLGGLAAGTDLGVLDLARKLGPAPANTI